MKNQNKAPAPSQPTPGPVLYPHTIAYTVIPLGEQLPRAVEFELRADGLERATLRALNRAQPYGLSAGELPSGRTYIHRLRRRGVPIVLRREAGERKYVLSAAVLVGGWA
jgi:hypothetical protein